MWQTRQYSRRSEASRCFLHTQVTVSIPRRSLGFGQSPGAGWRSWLVQTVARRLGYEWAKLPKDADVPFPIGCPVTHLLGWDRPALTDKESGPVLPLNIGK